jgi:hypothetical protein
VAWPLSSKLLARGFRDSYREMHPDPVKDPGITHPGSGERIDYVYAAGPSTTLTSKLVGERGGKGVDIAGVGKWTSDHRAVLSTFRVKPAKMPPLVAVSERLGIVGDRITVFYDARGDSAGRVEIRKAGAEPIASLPASGHRGAERIKTRGWTPGAYDVVLSDAQGAEIARVSLFLRAPHPRLSLSTDKRIYRRGELIKVAWSDAPVNRWDWIAVYKASAADPEKDSYLIWRYTAGHAAGTLPPKTDGAATLGRPGQGKAWPLPPGRYVIHYLLADQYHSAGRTSFTVRGHSR